MDVIKCSDVENFVKYVVIIYGKVDVMINNVGIMLLFILDKLKVDEWEKMIDVNIKGVLYGIVVVLFIM